MLFFRIFATMKIIRNPLLPPRRFAAINILGMLFCRKHTLLSAALIRHERIHTRQMIELAFAGFYLWYLVEWLIRLPQKGRAYYNISFEREAYAHMGEPDYLLHRRPYAWMKYLRQKSKRK